MNDVVQILESRYLPRLNEAASRLREGHPSFIINVGSQPIGRATTFKGHHVFVEVDRRGNANPEPNCVAMEICVRDLPGITTLCTLDVNWGGDGEAPMGGSDLLADEVVFDSQALLIIDEALPQLEAYLDQCLCAWEAMYPRRT